MTDASATFLVVAAVPVALVVAHAGFTAGDWIRGAAVIALAIIVRLAAKATRAAFRDANRTLALARAICADPIDAHFDTAITEPEWCVHADCAVGESDWDAETFADLRADWPAWEQEVRA